ncbi:MAG: hypothetical protein NTU61_03355 [Candidatus Altiarchaeota archaeon]|nr:hypothetical protein [Candidatus Altiarchaeota archaeon]
MVVKYTSDSRLSMFPELVDCVESKYLKVQEIEVSGVKYRIYQ